MARLAIVGVGRIGGEVAYLAASMGIIDELILYDVANDLLRHRFWISSIPGSQYPSARIKLQSGMQISAYFLPGCPGIPQ